VAVSRGGVRRGSRAFLLFVIAPPRICRTASEGDKKQRGKVDGCFSEPLRHNLGAPPLPPLVRNRYSARNSFLFSATVSAGEPFGDLEGLWPPFSTASPPDQRLLLWYLSQVCGLEVQSLRRQRQATGCRSTFLDCRMNILFNHFFNPFTRTTIAL